METTICTLVSLKDEKYKDVKNKLHDDPRKEVLSPHFFWLFEWLTLKWTKETPHRYWTIHWSSTITTKYLKEERKRNFFSKLDLSDSFSLDLQCLKFRMSFSCIYMVLPEVRFRNEIYKLFRKFSFQKISISKMLPQVKRWALKAFLN